jgi:hypothetical protein
MFFIIFFKGTPSWILQKKHFTATSAQIIGDMGENW